jgi:hypothetical protein
MLYMVVGAMVPRAINSKVFTMSKSSKATTVSAPVASAPVHPILAIATLAAAKQAKYASVAAIPGNAVISSFVANPKKGKSAVRYAQFYKVGITVDQFVAAYKAAGLAGVMARNDLRWDLQHGFITLG